MGTSDQQVDYLARRDGLAATWKEKGNFGREQPQQSVFVSGYSIARFPVMVGEYRVFLEAGGYGCDRYWTDLPVGRRF